MSAWPICMCFTPSSMSAAPSIPAMPHLQPHVGASTGTLESLETLTLRGNMLSGPLPSALAAAAKLKAIDVSGNKLTGTLGLFASALPAGGGATTHLLLDRNQLSGESMTQSHPGSHVCTHHAPSVVPPPHSCAATSCPVTESPSLGSHRGHNPGTRYRHYSLNMSSCSSLCLSGNCENMHEHSNHSSSCGWAGAGHNGAAGCCEGWQRAVSARQP